MKKVILFIIFLLLIIPINVNAQRGCCSHHGGVAGCSSSGRQICNDGTLSPSCTCTPTYVYGCTDKNANNYNSKANKDNGSCTYTIEGCTDKNANNYNSKANKDNGSCTYTIEGCTDKNANNYNSKANKDDGSCTYTIEGCTDKNSINYDETANTSDGSCLYEKELVIEETIPFETIKENSSNISNGKEEKIQDGQDGLKEVIYTVTYDEVGNEISRTLKNENIINEPVEEIIQILPSDNNTNNLSFSTIFTIVIVIIIIKAIIALVTINVCRKKRK
jgi:hypothetical protein